MTANTLPRPPPCCIYSFPRSVHLMDYTIFSTLARNTFRPIQNTLLTVQRPTYAVRSCPHQSSLSHTLPSIHLTPHLVLPLPPTAHLSRSLLVRLFASKHPPCSWRFPDRGIPSYSLLRSFSRPLRPESDAVSPDWSLLFDRPSCLFQSRTADVIPLGGLSIPPSHFGPSSLSPSRSHHPSILPSQRTEPATATSVIQINCTRFCAADLPASCPLSVRLHPTRLRRTAPVDSVRISPQSSSDNGQIDHCRQRVAGR
ncbi:hypothetical protein BD413DRAFT_281509 [Trametes elegans]|nr:hypothetical protein BD413DRAFT_281509 [Trametes elegans]